MNGYRSVLLDGDTNVFYAAESVEAHDMAHYYGTAQIYIGTG